MEIVQYSFWGDDLNVQTQAVSSFCILRQDLRIRASTRRQPKYSIVFIFKNQYRLHCRSSVCPNSELHYLVLCFHPVSQMLEESINCLLLSLPEINQMQIFKLVCPLSPRFACLCEEGQRCYCSLFHLYLKVRAKPVVVFSPRLFINTFFLY